MPEESMETYSPIVVMGYTILFHLLLKFLSEKIETVKCYSCTVVMDSGWRL